MPDVVPGGVEAFLIVSAKPMPDTLPYTAWIANFPKVQATWRAADHIVGRSNGFILLPFSSISCLLKSILSDSPSAWSRSSWRASDCNAAKAMLAK
jgi:hypothetical protein